MPERENDIGGDFRLALGFLTRLPAGHGGLAPGRLGRAARAFSAVGVIVGGLGGLAFWAASGLGLPPLPAALLTVAVVAWLTRGLHEDGLADFADGLAGASAARRLEIMRDSRSGAFGVIALVLALGLKAAALAELSEPVVVAHALIAAAAASRAGMVFLMYRLPAARTDGLGRHAGRPEQGDLVTAAAVGLAAIFLLLPWQAGLAAVIVAAIAVAAVGTIARARLGGTTGDVLGAGQQAGEIGFLLAVVAVVT
jgi:adenosylcobinamide-GDP ribazoletransferase